MPFIYATAAAANVATNATPNTDTDHLRLLTVAAKGAGIKALYLIGKGAGLTAISGIAARLVRYGTPSTVGAAITPSPRGTIGAASLTALTAPTVGATPLQQLVIGCGAAGPGGWVAPDVDSQISLDANGGANGNLDLLSSSGTAALNFQYSLEHAE
jgi:hypothetical protein